MSAPAYMPFYVADYLADTMHLSRDQHGAYLLLIFAYWRNGGPLPDDPEHLAAITKSSQTEWQKHSGAIGKFFQIDKVEKLWRHRRIDAELAKINQINEVRSKAGSKGAAKRWQSHWQNDAISDSESNSSGDKNLPHRAPAGASRVAARGGRDSPRNELWKAAERAAEAVTAREEAANGHARPQSEADQPGHLDQREQAPEPLRNRRSRSNGKAAGTRGLAR